MDESAQSTEINTLIPLNYDFEKIMLIGDHFQLPATIHSENSKVLGFDRSIFERLIKNDVETFILKEQ